MTEKEKFTYQADTLGVPPLRMVLTHAGNDRNKPVTQISRTQKSKLQKTGIGLEDLIRLVEHLKKKI